MKMAESIIGRRMGFDLDGGVSCLARYREISLAHIMRFTVRRIVTSRGMPDPTLALYGLFCFCQNRRGGCFGTLLCGSDPDILL